MAAPSNAVGKITGKSALRAIRLGKNPNYSDEARDARSEHARPTIAKPKTTHREAIQTQIVEAATHA
jgi:hypothetical protein